MSHEKTAFDAPVWYSAEQADAWAAGFNAALDRPPAAGMPVCQACKKPLAVADITGTAGLCCECVSDGFPPPSPPPSLGVVEPVAWRTRSIGEPLWEYDDKRMAEDDLFREEEGFEEQPLYAISSPPLPQSGRVREALQKIISAWERFENEQLQLDEGVIQAISEGAAALSQGQDTEALGARSDLRDTIKRVLYRYNASSLSADEAADDILSIACRSPAVSATENPDSLCDFIAANCTLSYEKSVDLTRLLSAEYDVRRRG